MLKQATDTKDRFMAGSYYKQLTLLFTTLFIYSASPAQSESNEEAKMRRFFAAQLKAQELQTEIKTAAEKARIAREAAALKKEARKNKEVARFGPNGRPPAAPGVRTTTAEEVANDKSLREAQRAEEEAELIAESEQIAFEELTLTKVQSDDPTLSDLIEAQRKEVVVRKRMLELRKQALSPTLRGK